MSQSQLITTSVSEQLTDIIREAIVTEKLLPGQRYSVQEILKRLDLGVSRTPVREALVRLADAGLVSFERNLGVRILKTDVHDLEELFQLRLMVEVPAAYRGAQNVDERLIDRLEDEIEAMRRAVKRRQEFINAEAADGTDGSSREELNIIVRDFLEHDTKFHELIIGAAGNIRLVRTVRTWRENISTLGGWRLTKSPSLEDLLEEHKEILKTLKGPQPDPQATAQTMYEHIRRTGDLLMKELQMELPDRGTFHSGWSEGIAAPESG